MDVVAFIRGRYLRTDCPKAAPAADTGEMRPLDIRRLSPKRDLRKAPSRKRRTGPHVFLVRARKSDFFLKGRTG
jgi:hypothetical protein